MAAAGLSGRLAGHAIAGHAPPPRRREL